MATKLKKKPVKPEAVKTIEDRLRNAGVPEHLTHVRKVPPMIEIDILLGGERQKTQVRCKANNRDITEAIKRCEATWRSHKTGMFSPDDAETRERKDERK